ncbi:MAG TPA: alpha-amylase family glycosyl hydrolase [Gaiellaceae bacterium]|nr:alpha-amylase family glycosyl hydrolase [Gaiellaceae bacterium]
MTTSGRREPPWWRRAVVYQVYPLSFADGDGDGLGDLAGIRSRLPYLQWLGVDALWLSPIYPSPLADFGYDVSDHCGVDPRFGDLAGLDALVGEAHARGLRVLLDWVPNHTSDRHPWFRDSRSSRSSRRRDWYVWRDGRGAEPPNNWRSAFGGPAWTLDDRTGQWYLHLFLREQPDLNWAHPQVREAMHDTLRFWLDRGVDGFRADVVHLIGKDPALPDQEPALGDVDRVAVHDEPLTHELLRGVRGVLEEYAGERLMVGEVNLRDTARIGTYYGAGDELHLAFNFLSLEAGFDPAAWRALVETVGRALPTGAWPTWVLSNHDNPRHRTRFGGSERRARAAALLLLTLRGTPFLFQGEELGLEDAHVPPQARVDPGGRDGARAPMPWTAGAPHGWPGRPLLPFPPEPDRRSVEAQRGTPASTLRLYRELLALRRRSAALREGDLHLLDHADADVLRYARSAGDERLEVAINFSSAPVALPDARGTSVVLASDDLRPGAPLAGEIPAECGVVLAG